MDMLDLYSDYLIFQNKYATATGLSDLVDGAFAHDKVTRFLRFEDFSSKSLWSYVKRVSPEDGTKPNKKCIFKDESLLNFASNFQCHE